MRLIQDHSERIGYLLKERGFDIATVVDALRRILEGETVIDPTIVSRLLGGRRREDPLSDSPNANVRSSRWSPRAGRTRRSPRGCPSPYAQWRRMSPTSS